MPDKKTSDAQLAAVSKYQSAAVRWAVTTKCDTRRGELLEKAKRSGTLPEKFWNFLENEYGEG